MHLRGSGVVALLFLSFFSLLSISYCSVPIILNYNTGETSTIEAQYTTLGSPFDISTIANFTIVNKENVGCRVEGIPSELIAGHFLVVTYDLTKSGTFKKCNNYYFDYFANIAYFAKSAEKSGALGVLVIRDKREAHYSDYRIAGFAKSVNIPVLVAKEEVIQSIAENYTSISSLEIPPIPSKEANLLSHYKGVFRGLNIANCVFFYLIQERWPILFAVTAYFMYVDIRVYLTLEPSIRRIHPTLTKAAPFISAIFASIWHISGPYSIHLNPHTPTTFFERIHLCFIFVTAWLLLKTWVLAIGDLKSPRIYKISLIVINSLIGLNLLLTVLWIAIGNAFRIVIIAFGVVTAVFCGLGFIFFGKDIVMILSKQGQNARFRELSIKIIVFIVIFVLFVYTCMIVYVGALIGESLSEFLMQFLLALAFITIYSVLFLRRNKYETGNDVSQGNSKSSRSNMSNSDKLTTDV